MLVLLTNISSSIITYYIYNVRIMKIGVLGQFLFGTTLLKIK